MLWGTSGGGGPISSWLPNIGAKTKVKGIIYKNRINLIDDLTPEKISQMVILQQLFIVQNFREIRV